MEVLQYLLDNAKLDLEATDDGGKTALYYAVGYDRLDCYKLLVQRGAKVDIKDNVRHSHARNHMRCRQALTHACPPLQNGYSLLFAAENEIMKDLLSKGLGKDANTAVGVRRVHASMPTAAPLHRAGAFIRTHAPFHWHRRPSSVTGQCAADGVCPAQHDHCHASAARCRRRRELRQRGAPLYPRSWPCAQI